MAEKKSAIALPASGLAPSAEVEGCELVAVGWGDGATSFQAVIGMSCGKPFRSTIHTLGSASTR